MAGCFSLTAFSVAIVSGLAAGRDAAAILETALICLIGALAIGVVFALIVRAAVRECLWQYESEHPIPVAGQATDHNDPMIDVAHPTAEAA